MAARGDCQKLFHVVLDSYAYDKLNKSEHTNDPAKYE